MFGLGLQGSAKPNKLSKITRQKERNIKFRHVEHKKTGTYPVMYSTLAPFIWSAKIHYARPRLLPFPPRSLWNLHGLGHSSASFGK